MINFVNIIHTVESHKSLLRIFILKSIFSGEEALPDEDLHKIFKPIPPPSRLNALVLAGQTLSSADNVSQFCTQSLAKWFVTEALQKAKVDDNQG